MFLSFADEDKEITEREIKVPLEELGYRVCWHHSDFICGVPIMENIATAVEESRFTITVLSSSFVRSDFCIKEMQLALIKSAHTRSIIPVLVEECEIPSDLTKLTYISLQEPGFLDKLTKDLGMLINCKTGL